MTHPGTGGWFEVLGARGSTPASGPGMDTYGGFTTAFAIRVDADNTVLIDAGTGLSFAGAHAHPGHTFHVFFTHYHLDHVIGLPFFPPIYDGATTFHFHGVPVGGTSLMAAIGGTFQPPWFPVCFGETAAIKHFHELDDQTVRVGDVAVSSIPLNHPQGCRGFRIEREGRSVVVATDHEAGDASIDRRLIEFAADADVFIHDAQYTPAQYPDHVGWGHSTYEHAVHAAAAAGVGRLVLTSHDPRHDDAAVDAIVNAAADTFHDVEGAAPGVVF